MSLQRHQLVRLNDEGWGRMLDRPWDAEARTCLTHWASNQLPLVVTRQPAGLPGAVIAVGLAAPATWSRRRLALQIAPSDVLAFDAFPRAGDIVAQLPQAARVPWEGLCTSLDDMGVDARVYGSHGWQLISGLRYVHRDSDIDLCLPVRDVAQAEMATTALDRFATAGRPRLDGELLFGDGQGYAWREWQAWQRGRCARLLSKSLTGPALVSCPGGRGFADPRALP